MSDTSHFYQTGKAIGKASKEFLVVYFKYFWILSILWLGFATKLIFRTYNYAEHVAISSFIIGQATLAGLVGYLIFRTPLFLNPIIYLVIAFMLFQVFKKENTFKEFFKSLIALFLFFIQLIVIVLIIGIIRA